MPDDDHGGALALAYRYLNRRDRTEAEVRKHLEGNSLDAPVIDRSILTLTEQGYVNDVRFARLFAQDKQELEQWGSERIRRGLLTRGISSNLIDATLDGEAPETELARALDLLRRRFPSPPAERRDRDRALGVLIRKGYNGEIALDALSAHARGD
ncbi:MAG: regulatory protein RecX [Solirubrobacteraceae bacterium]